MNDEFVHDPEGQLQPLAYRWGEFLPASQVAIPLWDAGFVQGVTITEQLRTFAGTLFRPKEHLGRLAASAEAVGLAESIDAERLLAAAEDLAACNARLLPPGGDLGLAILLSPGSYPAFLPDEEAAYGPGVLMHTYALPFHRWNAHYERGVDLIISQIHQVPSQCWSPAIKCRSRMHYFQADREAARRSPGSKAVLRDHNGDLTETSTANLVILQEDRSGGVVLVSPPKESILPGISLLAVADLAQQLGWEYREAPLRPDDVLSAEEAWLTSTPWCVLPAVRLEGQPIGHGRPGPKFHQLLRAWSDQVGVEIPAQGKPFL